MAPVEIGTRFETSSILLTESETIQFATQFDPQPMHVDPSAAEHGPFGRLTASGWHTLSLTMRLMALRQPFGGTPLVGVGVDKISFLQPVYPNTEIYVVAEVTGFRQSRKPGRGYVTLAVETRNRTNDEVVVQQIWTVLVPTETEQSAGH